MDFDSGSAVAGAVLATGATGILAFNDLVAMGLLSALADRGVRVPDDVSVVGFDDIAFAELASPPLTTVRQPLARMAAEAVRLLLDADDHMPGPPPRVELATHLVVRGSTGPAPGSA